MLNLTIVITKKRLLEFISPDISPNITHHPTIYHLKIGAIEASQFRNNNRI